MPGNEIDVSFGNSSDISWGTSQSVNLKNFIVATFAFTATSTGTWVCSFEAVSSAQAIKNLDAQITICNGCNTASGTGQGKTGPIKYITGVEKTQHPVKGIAQLIAADSQENGKVAIDDLDDGTVFTKDKFVNYNPGTKYGSDAALVVYKGDFMRDAMSEFAAWIGGVLKNIGLSSKSEVDTANNQVYVSLGYIVHRIIDDQLLRAMSCGIVQGNGKDRDRFSKLKVEFHPIYSKSKLPSGIVSGDPTTMLLLGAGNYKNDEGDGKDFDADCKNLSAVKAINGTDVKLQNILVHRDVITAAFNSATSARNTEADNTDVKDSKDQVVNINTFFEAIADHISSCTGGALALRLVEDPDDSTKLIVVDQNYGESDALTCIVFDRGDGSVRTCEIQSNVGSQEYRASMFSGSSKKGDTVANLRGCSPELENQRKKEYDKAKEDRDALIKNPGNLGKNQFNGQEINALKSAMGRLYKNNTDAQKTETLHWPGLSISVTIDGAYGIVPGCAISSTQVPREWRTNYASYFMVTKVTHTIQNSDWTTQIEGILAYYKNLKFVPDI